MHTFAAGTAIRHLRLQIGGACGSALCGSNREWEDHFVFVSEVHQRAERQALGRWKFECARSNSRGQRPAQTRRLAGVACILPVNVPPGLELEMKSGGVRLPVLAQRALGNQQFHAQMGSLGGSMRPGGLRRGALSRQTSASARVAIINGMCRIEIVKDAWRRTPSLRWTFAWRA